MKTIIYVLALVMAGQAYAQSNPAHSRIQYIAATNEVVEIPAPAGQAANPNASANATASNMQSQTQVVAPAPVSAPTQTIVTPAPIIVNNAAPTAQSLGMQPRVQEQPTTVIEEAPVKESRAEQLRKARTDMESNTDSKVVEKLEQARIEDEKARSERLFNGTILSQQQQPPPVMAQPVAPPTVEVAPAPAPPPVVVVEDKKEDVRPVVREEIHAALQENEEKKVEKSQGYVGALAGMTNFADSTSYNSKGSAGFNLGFASASHIIVEGGFLYSAFEQDVGPYNPYGYGYGGYNRYTGAPYNKLNQYNFTGALKYQILPGKLRPFVGGVVSYTYRSYTNDSSSAQTYYGLKDATTSAYDVGLTVGADLLLTDNFAIGADFRYMTNLASSKDAAYHQAFGYNPGATSIEDLDYYSITVSGKLMF